ncbi:hypothetical protein Tco_1061280, partial [Tanacetum coccineum]
GYPGKFYCLRMNSMNKPTYVAIQFAAAADEHLVQFLAMPKEEGHTIHKGCRLILVLMYQVNELQSRELKRLGMHLKYMGQGNKEYVGSDDDDDGDDGQGNEEYDGFDNDDDGDDAQGNEEYNGSDDDEYGDDGPDDDGRSMKMLFDHQHQIFFCRAYCG